MSGPSLRSNSCGEHSGVRKRDRVESRRSDRGSGRTWFLMCLVCKGATGYKHQRVLGMRCSLCGLWCFFSRCWTGRAMARCELSAASARTQLPITRMLALLTLACSQSGGRIRRAAASCGARVLRARSAVRAVRQTRTRRGRAWQCQLPRLGMGDARHRYIHSRTVRICHGSSCSVPVAMRVRLRRTGWSFEELRGIPFGGADRDWHGRYLGRSYRVHAAVLRERGTADATSVGDCGAVDTARARRSRGIAGAAGDDVTG